MQNAFPGLSEESLAAVASVWSAPDARLLTLIKAGGLNPKTDFRGGDLRGWPLAGQDLRGIDLTGADLRGTGIEYAITDETTILTGAKLGPIDGDLTLDRVPEYDFGRVKTLLSEAKKLEKANPLGAISLIEEARKRIDEWIDFDFLRWAPLLARTEIYWLRLSTDNSQRSLQAKSRLRNLVFALRKISNSNPRALSIILRYVIGEMNKKFKEYHFELYDEVVHFTIDATLKNINKFEYFKVAHALLSMIIDDFILLDDLQSARLQSEQLKRISHETASLFPTSSASYALRSEIKFASILAAGHDKKSIHIITEAINNYIYSDHSDNTNKINELIRAISCLIQICINFREGKSLSNTLHYWLDYIRLAAAKSSPVHAQKIAASTRRLFNSSKRKLNKPTVENIIFCEYMIRSDLLKRAQSIKNYSSLIAVIESWYSLYKESATVSSTLSEASEEVMMKIMHASSIKDASRHKRLVERSFAVYNKIFLSLEDFERIATIKHQIYLQFRN